MLEEIVCWGPGDRGWGAGGWWLTPVILATQETEIRRIVAQSQPQARPILKSPSQKRGERMLIEWLKV
jgi:hypothetical protein